MTTALEAFRGVNFDWTRQLKSIWADPAYHVPSLHAAAVDDIIDYFVSRTREPDLNDEPLGQASLLGQRDIGKTHLIGELRRRICSSAAGLSFWTLLASKISGPLSRLVF